VALLFRRPKNIPEVKNLIIDYFYSHRYYEYSLTKLGSTTIEDAEKTARATLEERDDCELAEILEIKWEPKYGDIKLGMDGLSFVMAIYKKDISFGISTCEPDEVDPEGKIRRDTAFTYKKNYLAEFQTYGYTDIKINVHDHEIYAGTLEECLSSAKQKLWEVFAFRYACIYKARPDKIRGGLVKILEKVNDTYDVETCDFQSPNSNHSFNEYLEMTEIYDSLSPEIEEKTETVEIRRRVERYNQHLEREERDIKSIALSDKEGYFAIHFTWPESPLPFYIPSDLLVKLKNRFKSEEFVGKTVVCWYDQKRIIYKIFPGYKYHL